MKAILWVLIHNVVVHPVYGVCLAAQMAAERLHDATAGKMKESERGTFHAHVYVEREQ